MIQRIIVRIGRGIGRQDLWYVIMDVSPCRMSECMSLEGGRGDEGNINIPHVTISCWVGDWLAQAMSSGHVLVNITTVLTGRIGRSTHITGGGRGCINLEGGGRGNKGNINIPHVTISWWVWGRLTQGMCSGHVLVKITINLTEIVSGCTRITGGGNGCINLEGGGRGDNIPHVTISWRMGVLLAQVMCSGHVLVDITFNTP